MRLLLATRRNRSEIARVRLHAAMWVLGGDHQPCAAVSGNEGWLPRMVVVAWWRELGPHMHAVCGAGD